MSLCDNQTNFNDAYYKASENYINKKERQYNSLVLYPIVHFVFLVWGVILALKSAPPENRVIHLTLALLVSPLYVLAYYLNMLK